MHTDDSILATIGQSGVMADLVGRAAPLGAPAAAGVGLSLSHISPRGKLNNNKDVVVELRKGGSLISIKQAPPPRGVKRVQRGGGRRGRISGFSKQSRMRLQKELGKVDRAELCKGLFVTLTYPAVYPGTVAAKKHLQALCKRLRRKFPAAHLALVWKLEFQERGAPHFHLLILGLPYLPYDWLAQSWYEVVGSADQRHLQAGTQVKRVRSYKQVVAYATKYFAKEIVGAVDTGRCWGISGAWYKYMAELVAYLLPVYKAARLARLLDKFVLSYKRLRGDWRGVARRRRRRDVSAGNTWYCDTIQWLRLLTDLDSLRPVPA